MVFGSGVDERDGKLEGVDGVTVFLVERPANLGVEGFHRGFGLLGYMPHNRGNHFALVEALFTFHNVLWRHPALRQVNVACLATVVSFGKSRFKRILGSYDFVKSRV